MKLKDIKLNEGHVDAAVLFTLTEVARHGITDDSQVVVLAKCLMAIQEGHVGTAVNFNAYYNEFFPGTGLLNSLSSLSKEEILQLAAFVLRVLKAKDEQLASLRALEYYQTFLTYATQAEAND